MNTDIPLFDLAPPQFHMLSLVDLEKRPSVATCVCGETARSEHPAALEAIRAHVARMSIAA